VNAQSAVINPASGVFLGRPSVQPPARSSWLLLPAAAQVLPAKTACDIGVTEGRTRFAVFLLAALLFSVIVPTEIAADSEMFVSRTVLGVPPHYAITASTFALALLADARYYQRLLSRPPVAIGLACLGALLVEGVARYGLRSHLVRSDIYIVRWFFVGFILMRLSIATGRLRAYLVLAAVVIIATALSIDTKNTEAGQVDTAIRRATSANLWPVANCGTIMIGLLLTVAWPRSWSFAAFGAGAYALLMFVTSIRSSTRSLFLVQSLCLILTLIALSRDPRMRGRGRGIQRVATAFAVFGAGLLIYQVSVGALLGDYSQIADRLEDTARESRIGAGRIDEAVELIEGLTPEEWIIGKGLGGMFYSKLGFWSNVPHIAVLCWLQKGGLPILLLVLVTVYIVPSVAFVRQLTAPRRNSPLPAPILVVGSALVSWCFLTFVSGGIDLGALLGLGGLTALWMQLYDDDRVFAGERRRPVQAAGVADRVGAVFGPVGAT